MVVLNHAQKTTLGYGDWNIEFVSDFNIQISDLRKPHQADHENRTLRKSNRCENPDIIYLNIFSASRHL